MQKKYYIFVLVALVFGSTWYVHSPQPNSEAVVLPREEAVVVPATKQSASALIPTTRPALAPISGPTVNLNVEGNSYATAFVENANVLDAMRALASTTEFRFEGKEYPSLGFFVEEVKGKKGENGYYWFLYVNGKESRTGASQTTLNAGDFVEWRYKKGY